MGFLLNEYFFYIYIYLFERVLYDIPSKTNEVHAGFHGGRLQENFVYNYSRLSKFIKYAISLFVFFLNGDFIVNFFEDIFYFFFCIFINFHHTMHMVSEQILNLLESFESNVNILMNILIYEYIDDASLW